MKIPTGLKKTLDVIWLILNSRIFYFLIIVAILFFGVQQCSSKKDAIAEQTKAEQNYSASQDTLKLYKLKNGELRGEKEIFIKSEKELKEENSDLYRRVKEQNGNVISLNRTIIRLRQNEKMLNDSIKTLHKIIGEPVQIDSNTWMLPWELEYNWDENNSDIFKGKTFVSVSNKDPLKLKHDNTILYSRDSKIDIEFGEKVVDGKYNVFIQSAYPGFSPEQMEGVFIDPNTNKDIRKLMKKRHWMTGFSVSLSITPGYNLSTGKPSIVVGPSIGWNIYQW